MNGAEHIIGRIGTNERMGKEEENEWRKRK